MEIFKEFISMFKSSKHKEPIFDYYKAMSGTVPGGIYNGIMSIPGDPDGEWVEGRKYGACPACEKGELIFYWQNEYYRLKCCVCKFLYDTGIRLQSISED